MIFSVVQTITGMIGSVGFAVLFGVRGRKLAVIALGSGAGWAVYLVCRALGCSIFAGLLAASLFVAALSEILARILRTPVILLLVKAGIGVQPDKIMIGDIMLVIPGLQLTNSLRDMINGDMISGLLNMSEALLKAVAVAVGFAVIIIWGGAI